MIDHTDDAAGLPDVGEDIYQQLTRTLGYEPGARVAGGSARRAPAGEPSVPAQPVLASAEPLADDPHEISPFRLLDDVPPSGLEASAEDSESPFGDVPLDELSFGVAVPEEGTADLTAFREAALARPRESAPPADAGESSSGAAGPRPVEDPAEPRVRDRSAAEFYARLPDPPPFGAPR